MSILIKGMEMPKDGTYNIVHIYSDGRVSMPFWGKGMQIVQDINAIPVPPHGRLIDADELEKKFCSHCDDYMSGKDECKEGCFDLKMIKSMPKVIPADKDGET